MKIQMKNGIAEVLLYEDIGGWFGITADMFVKEIRTLKNISTINLRINSNGGNVFDGVAIYNYLKSHQARVEVDVDGLAASIASLIAMAGDEVRMADNGWMMIHDPWMLAVGTSEELRKAADTMDGVRDTLLDTYMKRATVERDDLSNMLTDETWLNANQAQEIGLVDSVTEEMRIAANVNRDWFKHPPENIDRTEVKVEYIPERTPARKRLEEARARMQHGLRLQNLAD